MTSKLIVVSGAGLSASAGIPTYGTNTGLWSLNDMKTICVKGTELTQKSIDFYENFRAMESRVEPSVVHQFFAQLQSRYGAERVKLYTQNIDTLLERGGCSVVNHVHGNISEFKCVLCEKVIKETENHLGKCPNCLGTLRRNIVFYGERGYYGDMMDDLIDLEPDDVFILLGTSGKAINPDVYVRSSKCHKLYVNLNVEPNVNIQKYEKVILGNAEHNLPDIQAFVSQWMVN